MTRRDPRLKMPKELRPLAKQARRAGWSIDRNASGHLAWTGPDGAALVTACTPSSPGSVRHDVLRVRRALAEAPVISEADTMEGMPEHIVPDYLSGGIDTLLARFQELLAAAGTELVDDDGTYTETRGLDAVEDLQRISLDLDDVTMDLEQVVRRDLAQRTLPTQVVYAGRAWMDDVNQIHLVLAWREQP